MRRPAGRSEDALVDFSVGFIKLIASPAYPYEASALATRVRTGIRRAVCGSTMRSRAVGPSARSTTR